MVEYITRDELRSLGQKSLNENLQKVRKAEGRSPAGNTFLSHSSKDDELMPAVVLILENHGATVYLDKKDAGLAIKSPKEIATTLRSRISVSSKFILFASENNKTSKWTPWELGLADGFKSPQKVCIFPAPEKLPIMYGRSKNTWAFTTELSGGNSKVKKKKNGWYGTKKKIRQ